MWRDKENAIKTQGRGDQNVQGTRSNQFALHELTSIDLVLILVWSGFDLVFCLPENAINLCINRDQNKHKTRSNLIYYVIKSALISVWSSSDLVLILFWSRLPEPLLQTYLDALALVMPPAQHAAPHSADGDDEDDREEEWVFICWYLWFMKMFQGWAVEFKCFWMTCCSATVERSERWSAQLCKHRGCACSCCLLAALNLE